jgi:putative Mg2+ transporter-C (MgtC) family protein
MESEWLKISMHLIVATIAGGLIGLERSYHGRPAGFRTHTLVCLASSLLMLVTVYQNKWFTGVSLETTRIDPTRMAQGVMTGIGFLGAGVIMREGLTVRGLTTAASIWITAAIGILAGVGFYSVVLMASVITLGALSVFRRIEHLMPAQIFANHILLFNRNSVMAEAQIKELLTANGFSVANLSYSLLDKGEHLECRMTIRTTDNKNFEKLRDSLLKSSDIIEFDISLAVG